MRAAVLLLLPTLAPAQQADAVRQAMEASLARQRASVERQLASVRRQAEAAGVGEFFTGAALQARAQCDPVPEDQIAALVEEISKREGLTPDLLRAIIQKESSFLPCAVSPKGAQGLMQLMPGTAAQLGVLDPLDPNQNVAGGARFLRQLLTRYDGDLGLALGAYNAGPARVDLFRGLPPFPETVNYVESILGTPGVSRQR